MKTSVLTLLSVVSLTSASNIFEPVAGTKEERLLACSSSPIDPASLHFMKVGQIRSHGGFIHLASKSNISSLPHLVLKACAHILDLKQLTLFKQLEKAASKNTYPHKRKSKLQGHYSRVFELLSSQCISTLDRTVCLGNQGVFPQVSVQTSKPHFLRTEYTNVIMPMYYANVILFGEISLPCYALLACSY